MIFSTDKIKRLFYQTFTPTGQPVDLPRNEWQFSRDQKWHYHHADRFSTKLFNFLGFPTRNMTYGYFAKNDLRNLSNVLENFFRNLFDWPRGTTRKQKIWHLLKLPVMLTWNLVMVPVNLAVNLMKFVTIIMPSLSVMLVDAIGKGADDDRKVALRRNQSIRAFLLGLLLTLAFGASILLNTFVFFSRAILAPSLGFYKAGKLGSKLEGKKGTLASLVLVMLSGATTLAVYAILFPLAFKRAVALMNTQTFPPLVVKCMQAIQTAYTWCLGKVPASWFVATQGISAQVAGVGTKVNLGISKLVQSGLVLDGAVISPLVLGMVAVGSAASVVVYNVREFNVIGVTKNKIAEGFNFTKNKIVEGFNFTKNKIKNGWLGVKNTVGLKVSAAKKSIRVFKAKVMPKRQQQLKPVAKLAVVDPENSPPALPPVKAAPILQRVSGMVAGALNMVLPVAAPKQLPPYDPNKPMQFKDLKLGKELGKGGFGVVYQATYQGITVAVKRPVDPNYLSPKELEEFKREAAMMTRLQSKYIVTCFGACFMGSQCFLVLEFMENGSLGDFLRNAKPPIQLGGAVYFNLAESTAQGLKVLHENGIVHMDVKPANYLVNKAGECKVSDFGLAKYKPDDGKTLIGPVGVGGTPGYIAPELCRGEKVTTESDMFSWATVLWALGEQGRRPPQIKKENEIAATTPQPIKQLIVNGWKDRREDRPTAASAVGVIGQEKRRLGF